MISKTFSLLSGKLGNDARRTIVPARLSSYGNTLRQLLAQAKLQGNSHMELVSGYIHKA